MLREGLFEGSIDLGFGVGGLRSRRLGNDDFKVGVGEGSRSRLIRSA